MVWKVEVTGDFKISASVVLGLEKICLGRFPEEFLSEQVKLQAASLRCEGKLTKAPVATVYMKNKRAYGTQRFWWPSQFSGMSPEGMK